jgi:transcriptional regulator of acetoin/glycerol metabolism
MYQRKLMRKQIESSGLRLGDSCSIFPSMGKKKAFTLNRHCIDLVSPKFRPDNLSMSYVELPNTDVNHFHYRLELDHADESGRFVLKTMTGSAFWLNGSAAKEAYIERLDRLYIDDNKINFDPFDLSEILNRHFEHPILLETPLVTSDLKILIEGETGTGKTHLAKKIHEKSGRSGNFIAVNLSSFNPNLIESELFGHRKGAFTGAISDKVGAFEEAKNGTLFLDEIDSLPLNLQTKLLTFLDSNHFRRVGDTKETGIKTRLIFASGRSLEKLTQEGKFRKDFYYRIKSGHTVELESLRNDTRRIKEACQYFSLKHTVSLSQRLIEFYETLAWPGNMRQLFGHLEKKKILSKSIKLDFDQFDEALLLQSSDLTALEEKEIKPMDEVKQDHARRVLSLSHGNLALTARRLKITEKTVKSLVGKIS